MGSVAAKGCSDRRSKERCCPKPQFDKKQYIDEVFNSARVLAGPGVGVELLGEVILERVDGQSRHEKPCKGEIGPPAHLLGFAHRHVPLPQVERKGGVGAKRLRTRAGASSSASRSLPRRTRPCSSASRTASPRCSGLVGEAATSSKVPRGG